MKNLGWILVWLVFLFAVGGLALVFVEKKPEPKIWLDGHGAVLAYAENLQSADDAERTISVGACYAMVDDARAHAQRCYDEIDELYVKSKLPRNCEWQGIDSANDISIFHCKPFTGEVYDADINADLDGIDWPTGINDSRWLP